MSCTTGIPTSLVPDTYGREDGEKGPENLLPASVTFEKKLSAIHTEGIVQLERHGLATPPDRRATVLKPLINTFDLQLKALTPQCPGQMGKYVVRSFMRGQLTATANFYLQAAHLQVLCFHLFIPREIIEETTLQRIYELACSTIETAQRINAEQGLSDCAPIFVSKYLQLAAFTILRIVRCYLSTVLNVDRGRQVYFFVINLHHDLSVQSGDIWSRAVGILTQLWASKRVFRRSDGSIDSLTLRCGSRLAMSVA